MYTHYIYTVYVHMYIGYLLGLPTRGTYYGVQQYITISDEGIILMIRLFAQEHYYEKYKLHYKYYVLNSINILP